MLCFGQHTEGVHNVMFCIFQQLTRQVGVGVLEVPQIPVILEVLKQAVWGWVVWDVGNSQKSRPRCDKHRGDSVCLQSHR